MNSIKHKSYFNQKSSIKLIVRCGLFFLLLISLFRDILYYYNVINIPEVNLLSWQILLTVIIEIMYLLMNSKVYKLGFAFMIYTYTILTHFGFVCAILFDNTLIFLKSKASMAFYYDDHMIKALLISSIVIEIFTFSISYFSSRRSKVHQNNSENKLDYSDHKKNYINNTSWYFRIILALQIVIFLYLVYITISYNLLSIPYGTRWGVINSIPFYGDSMILYSLTFAIILIIGNKKIKNVSFFVYTLTAIVHFSLGNRGEVFYSAVICFAIYYMQAKKIKKLWIMLGLITVLVIPNIRYMRQMDFDKINFSLFYSILETSAELGWQISPFTYIVKYLETDGNYAHGGTYLLYFYDFIARKISFLPQINSDFNPYRIVDLMPYDGMGFTMIAEAFYNFGVFGASICYVVFARFLTRAEYKVWNETGTVHSRVFNSLLVIEFVNLTRNSSSTLPLYLAYIVLLCIPIIMTNIKKT